MPLNSLQSNDIQDLDKLPELWPELDLFEEITPPPIPSTVLPEWLGEFVEALSDSTQTPIEMAILFALPVLATCVQSKVRISPTGDDYSEPVNCWTVSALPPSTRKSPIVNQLTAPLREWEKEQEAKVRPLIDEAEARKAINAKRIAELQGSASKESDSKARGAIVAEIAQLKNEDRDPPCLPQLFTGDITAEELQNQLVVHKGKMSVLSDEGGIFEVMTGLYNDGKANTDAFLQAFSGTPIRVNRGQRQVSIDNPHLSFGLTVQPEILKNLGRGSKQKLRGVGALARFLYAMPKSNIGKRNVRHNKPVPQGVKEVYYYNLKTLLNLQTPTDLEGGPMRLTLSSEALEAWYTFAQEIENKQGTGKPYESFQDWTGKLPGTALRIAALFHVSLHWFSKTTVEIDCMQKSVSLCELLIDHARAAFAEMSRSNLTEDMKHIIDHLKLNQAESIPRREIQRLGRFSTSPKERLNKALDSLIERGVLKGEMKSSATKPSQIYKINPKLYF